MNEMFAQGDLLIERVADVEPSGTVMAPDATGVCVLAEPLIRICKCCLSTNDVLNRVRCGKCSVPGLSIR